MLAILRPIREIHCKSRLLITKLIKLLIFMYVFASCLSYGEVLLSIFVSTCLSKIECVSLFFAAQCMSPDYSGRMQTCCERDHGTE